MGSNGDGEKDDGLLESFSNFVFGTAWEGSGSSGGSARPSSEDQARRSLREEKSTRPEGERREERRFSSDRGRERRPWSDRRGFGGGEGRSPRNGPSFGERRSSWGTVPSGEGRSPRNGPPFGDRRPQGNNFAGGRPFGERRRPFGGDGSGGFGTKRDFRGGRPIGSDSRQPGEGRGFSERRPFGEGQPSSERRPYGERKFGGERRGPCNRREGESGGGRFSERRPRRDGESRPPFREREFVPPSADFTVTFYATDDAFAPVADMIHRSGKAFDVFQVAKTFLAEPGRFAVVLRKNPEEESLFHSTAFDDLPFLDREDALGHLLRNHLDSIFDRIEEDVEAPKGSFAQIARCPFTKRLIGAPNHHSYKDLLQEHFLQCVRNMPFDRYSERLEFTNEAEDIAAWLEQMKKRSSYRPKNIGANDGKTSEATADPEVVANGEAVTANEVVEDTATEEPISGDKVPTGEEKIYANAAESAASEKKGGGADDRPVFHSLREVRNYLKENADQFLRTKKSIRLEGKDLELLADNAIRRFVDYCWGQQKRFPLDTASAMRSKFKQHKLHIFKHGKKGPSYVTPVARKFREWDTVFTPELERVLAAIESNPLIALMDLVAQLGSADVEREETVKALKWLLREGYVTELENGTLLTYPRLAKESEKSTEKGKSVGQAEKTSNGSHLEHLAHGKEHGRGDEGDSAGEEEDDGRLKDGGEPLDDAAQLLLQNICGVSCHRGESSTSFADGDESPDRGRHDGGLAEQLAEGDALSGSDGDGLEVAAKCDVSYGTAGKAECLRENDAMAQCHAQRAEKGNEPLPADEITQQGDVQQ
jgi:hypothetical protein